VTPFLGKAVHAVDDKGRTNVPSSFREILLKRESTLEMVLMKGFDGCLYMLPLSEWERFQGWFDQEEFESEEDARWFERELLLDGTVVLPDAQGRVQIPKELRDFADIGKEALFLGVRNRIELWSPLRFQDYRTKERDAKKTLEDMAKSYRRRPVSGDPRNQTQREG
jgi:MraZ protein